MKFICRGEKAGEFRESFMGPAKLGYRSQRGKISTQARGECLKEGGGQTRDV